MCFRVAGKIPRPESPATPRLHAAKRDVIIYDYVDEREPLLAKMARKREAGYRNLGYRAVDGGELGL
jgi:hypothetical protein